MTKIIDGFNDLIYKVVEYTLVILGFYAACEILFVMNIPIAASGVVIIFIFLVAFLASGEEKEVPAIPIMIIQGGTPAMPGEATND